MTDVRAAMGIAGSSETPHTQSAQALNIILSNIDMAADDAGPICQDTGMPTFEIKVPVGANQIWMRQQIREAVAEATVAATLPRAMAVKPMEDWMVAVERAERLGADLQLDSVAATRPVDGT